MPFDVVALEQQVVDAMERARIPGLALAVVRGADVVHALGFGVTSVEDGGQAVTPETVFRPGSTAKAFTGSAVMRLVEQGLLDLDRPVREYVGWLALSDPEATARVTLRMLLSHQAGLGTAAESFGSRDPSGLERYVREELPRVPLIAPPGKVWSYSNPGISLAGYVAEVAAGKPYADLVRELVLEPLGMSRTTFDPTVAMTYPLAQSHVLGEDGGLRVEHRFADNVGLYPAGFAFSTALDLARFAVMQLNGGCFAGRRVLAAASVAEMRRRQARIFGPDPEAGYGITFRVGARKGARWVGHGGAISGFGSVFEMLPDHGLAVVALFNRLAPDAPITEIVHGVVDGVLGLPRDEPRPAPIVPRRDAWPAYAGTYLGELEGLVTVRAADDRLELDHNGETMPLVALADDVYAHRGADERGRERETTIGFVPEEDGPVEYVVVNGTPARRFVPDPAFTADRGAWSAYAGTYTGDLDRIAVWVEDGRLRLRFDLRERELACTPIGPALFACAFGRFAFERGQDGATTLRWGSAFAFRREAAP